MIAFIGIPGPFAVGDRKTVEHRIECLTTTEEHHATEIGIDRMSAVDDGDIRHAGPVQEQQWRPIMALPRLLFRWAAAHALARR